MKFSESTIRQIVEQVLRESLGGAPCEFEKHRDPSGITGIKTATVRCEPFGDRPGVALKDVFDPEEAPRMGAGVMELDHGALEWTAPYDEYDVVLDGTLEIEVDGRMLSAKPGDIFYVPKGTHFYFRTSDKTRYAYFVYPPYGQGA